MSDISRWMEAINDWYCNDITRLVKTVCDVFSVTSVTDKSQSGPRSESPETRRDLYIFRTAEMTNEPSSGGSTVAPATVPELGAEQQQQSRFWKCSKDCSCSTCKDTQQQEEQNTGADKQRVITQQPMPDPVSNEPVSGSSANSLPEDSSGEVHQVVMDPASSIVRYQHTSGQSTSSAVMTRETTVEMATAEPSRRDSVEIAHLDDLPQKAADEAVGGNSLTQEEIDLEIYEDNSAPTAQEAKQKKMMSRQDAVCNSSNEATPRSDGLSTHNEVLSPLAQQSTSNTDVEKESDDSTTKKDPQEDDKDNEGSSGLLRGANALCLPDEYGEHFRSSTPHHSELFGSIIVDDQKEQEPKNWLDHFREEYAEYSLWN